MGILPVAGCPLYGMCFPSSCLASLLNGDVKHFAAVRPDSSTSIPSHDKSQVWVGGRQGPTYLLVVEFQRL